VIARFKTLDRDLLRNPEDFASVSKRYLLHSYGADDLAKDFIGLTGHEVNVSCLYM
jgi:hypothetical protein